MSRRRRPLPASKRQRVATRWPECAYCGRSFCDLSQRTIDHIVPLSRGGKSDIGNLVGCCLACNHAKADRTPEEWIADIVEAARLAGYKIDAEAASVALERLRR